MAERVAVIGAGQMGNGIAHVFAQSGSDVTMIDVSADALARGKATISANLDRQIKKGSLQASAKEAILGRVATAQTLDAAKDATTSSSRSSRSSTRSLSPMRFSARTRARSRSPRSPAAPSGPRT